MEMHVYVKVQILAGCIMNTGDTMNMYMILNLIVIVLECIGLYISISARKLTVFAYYTQLSNLVTIVSSILLVLSGFNEVTVFLRYLSTCMLVMTFLITLFVLVPMGGGFRKLMLSGNGLYHHTLCPIISVYSYIVHEQHTGCWYIPALVTLIYGLIMLYMNRIEKFDGPYPFFRVNHQSVRATVLWVAVLLLIISVISIGIARIAV